MNEREKGYLYYLFSAPGVGRVTALKMLEAFGTAEGVYRQAERAAERFMPDKSRGAFLNFTAQFAPSEEWEKLAAGGISFTALPLPDYPEKLRSIPDPPFGITWIGRLPSPDVPSVSIIGSRQCSDYGRLAAQEFGNALAVAGVQIVSGMAVGVDGLSQAAALRAGGYSLGILGSGVDVCYPEGNRKLYEELKQSGGILSEHPPGTLPRKNSFAMRNRLISAFCDILLVIEARKRSGTLITVDMALEQGRDVFALPGRITDALSDGCNRLIRQGAGIATCPSDITDAIFRTKTPERPEGPAEPDYTQLSEDEALIAGQLDVTARSVSDIETALAARGTPREVTVIMELLVELCIKGIAEQEGGCFKRRMLPSP